MVVEVISGLEGSGIEPGTPGDYNVKAVHYGRIKAHEPADINVGRESR